jgi:hypothetical protein
MKIVAVIVAIIVVLAVGLIAYAATKPDEIHVSRTVTINAPAEQIFPQINDFQAWQSWSPYETKDPGMKRELGVPVAGKGATYAWDGNNEVGQGKMEIIESTPPSRVVIKLTFLRPMENEGIADFALLPTPQGTDVSWTMATPAPLMSKIMSVFVDLDQMIGKDFETGLANLKSRVETAGQ